MSTISKEEAWDGEHLSDVAVTLLADAQMDLVDASVVSHAETCEACAGRVGQAAVLSSRIDAGLEVVPRSVPETVAHRFPAWLVAAALVLATLGFLPSAEGTIASLMADAADLPSSWTSAADSALTVAGDVAGTPLFAASTFAAAAFLALLGYFIARGGRGLSHSESSS